MSKRRSTGLGGLGLDALIGGKESVETHLPDGQVEKLALDSLQVGGYQPRKHFDEESIAELAESIKSQGLVQPIIVRKLAGTDKFEIIAGERRWRAAQKAGLATIAAIIREVDDEQVLAMALIENIQREDLNALEEAFALKRLIDEFSLTQQEAADAVGRSRAAVANLLRLLKLPQLIQEWLADDQLSMGHVRALINLPESRQFQLGQMAIDKGWSVRQMEQAAQEPEKVPAEPKKADPNIKSLENHLAENLGAKVKIKHSASGRGRLEIAYSDLDELDRIIAQIK